MSELVRFSFPLTPRMRSFLELRDALRCLARAARDGQPSSWLHAACDLRASLLGEQGRKCALPEMTALMVSMQVHLQQLGQDMPQYQNGIEQACDSLSGHIRALQGGLAEVAGFLKRDALISAYLNAQKKQDWLGHRLGLPQSLETLWSGAGNRAAWLQRQLAPLESAVSEIDRMLNDYVRWEERVARDGCGQITPERGGSHGLLVIGLSAGAVADGIIPDVSGNRHAIRLRFQRWQTGEAPAEVSDDQPYVMMLIPVT